MKAGGIDAYNIARWDGQAWHALEVGAWLPDDLDPWGVVFAITGDGTNVYVGGEFIQAGQVATTNLARWNGTHWDSIGSSAGGQTAITYQAEPLYGSVAVLQMNLGSLYAGGDFSSVGGVAAANVARWDGTNWTSVGDPNGQVFVMESFSGSLFIAGGFDYIGGITTSNLAVFEEGAWHPLNTGIHRPNEQINTIFHAGQKLYVGGRFSTLDGTSAGNIGVRDGAQWSALAPGTGNSLGGSVFATATDGTNVYAAGYFSTVGILEVPGLAKWDGFAWSGLGAGLSGDIAYLAVAGGKLYAGGYLKIDGQPDSSLAGWNGSAWSLVGDRKYAGIYALAPFQDKLYVLGSVIDSESDGATRVVFAEWNGTVWRDISWNAGELEPGGALGLGQQGLYIAATINVPPTGSASLVVGRWDGTQLQFLKGTIPDVDPRAVGSFGTNVYVSVQYFEDNTAHNLFSWTGDSWAEWGGPRSPGFQVNALASSRGGIYVAGKFEMIGGIHATNIAFWSGTEWRTLETGLNGAPDSTVLCLAAGERDVFAGGVFSRAGGNDSGNFAHWTPGVQLLRISTEASGYLSFGIQGLPRDQLEIQSSDNLRDWSIVGPAALTKEIEAYGVGFVPAATGSRFYRARLVR